MVDQYRSAHLAQGKIVNVIATTATRAPVYRHTRRWHSIASCTLFQKYFRYPVGCCRGKLRSGVSRTESNWVSSCWSVVPIDIGSQTTIADSSQLCHTFTYDVSIRSGENFERRTVYFCNGNGQ